MYTVCVLYSPKWNKIYIGQTDNLEKRLARHNRGMVKWTKPYCTWQLLYTESYPDRAEAMSRERELNSHQGRDYVRCTLLNGRGSGL